MAGKINPEDAFRLLKPSGNKKRSFKSGRPEKHVDPEDLMLGAPKESPKWLRYTISTIAVVLAAGFTFALIYSGYLLINKNDPVFSFYTAEPPLVIFSEDEAAALITESLKSFLSSDTTEERLGYILTPAKDQKLLEDYYDKRHHFDSPLWKIKLIKPANLQGIQIWMVAYLDINKALHYATFEQSGDQFLLQWPSSYAYGEVPWDEFASQTPEGPIQMRAYVRGHQGTYPPGISPSTHLCFVVENKKGDYTTLAIMERGSVGSTALSEIPPDARTPVNLAMGYTTLPNGLRRLIVYELIHFQWYQHTRYEKGQPLQIND